MTDYRDYGYANPATTTGFLSNTRQICMEIDDFRQTNKKALDRNTEMIKEQNVENRANFSNLFDKLRMSFFKIFTKNGLENDNETFYNMVQKENDDTQTAIQAHQQLLSASLTTDASTIEKAIKENTSEGKVNVNNLIAALDKIKQAQLDAKDELARLDTSVIKTAIEANTADGKVNVANLINSLNSLRTGQTEIKNAIGQIQKV